MTGKYLTNSCDNKLSKDMEDAHKSKTTFKNDGEGWGGGG